METLILRLIVQFCKIADTQRGCTYLGAIGINKVKPGSTTASEAKRACLEDGAFKTHIGGQALIEGVMMRGHHAWALAVRKPDGTLYEEVFPLDAAKRQGWKSWPLVRGCFALIDSLLLGFKALELAANQAFSETENKETGEASTGKAASDKGTQAHEEGFSHGEMILSIMLGLVLAIALFVVIPAAISQLIVGDYAQATIAWNSVDAVARVVCFIGYVWLIGRIKDIKRLFAYHGAEHKTIHCFEHGLPLTPENARQFPCLHVRCGTAFLIMTIVIAIVVYTLIPFNLAIEALGITNPIASFGALVGMRIVLLPLIAGISYEITVKWAGNHADSKLVQLVLWPGLQMQRLTTHEPDDEQLMCAIRAMQQVLVYEEGTRV